MTVNNENLVWIDLEMTGLEPATDVILEIATIVTDKQLNILAEGPVLAIRQSDEVLDNMDPWCVDVHGKSGLTKRCRESNISEHDAVVLTIEFLKKYVPAGKSPLCGNTIGQDRRFLNKYMRDLEDYFHYRSIDVSTVKELIKRWKPDVLDGFDKKGTHQALDDIRESIDEMAFYRKHVFNI